MLLLSLRIINFNPSISILCFVRVSKLIVILSINLISSSELNDLTKFLMIDENVIYRFSFSLLFSIMKDLIS